MANKNTKVLVIDDDEDVLTSARLLLKVNGYQVITDKNPENIAHILQKENIGLMLLDMNFKSQLNTGNEGIFWLNEIKSKYPELVVVLITAYGDVELAVKALKEGANDFVLKPWQNAKLLATVHSSLQLYETSIKAKGLKQEKEILHNEIDKDFKNIIGKSEAMQKVFRVIDKVATTDANVLILGENGTGKELVARAIHKQSLRAQKPFISVDMGALSENLFESELFGHVKGAFTDAKEDRAGRFEVASGGTLFLDEIGNLSLAMQAKLLQVLQNRQVVRVGSNKVIPIDIRLICATNQPLAQMVKEKTFRQDLLYRMNTVEILLPPLRDRQGDVGLLVQYFAEMYAKKYQKKHKSVTKSCLKELERYPWYGNVRELQHSVERAVIMSEEDELCIADFFFFHEETEMEAGNNANTANLEEIEKKMIQNALKKYHGNISHAAKELGLTRASLYRRMKKFDL